MSINLTSMLTPLQQFYLFDADYGHTKIGRKERSQFTIEDCEDNE